MKSKHHFFNIVSIALLGILFIVKPAIAETFTSNITISSGDATYEGQDIVVDGATVTINGPHSFNSLQVINGGVVTHSANSDTQETLMNLTITTNVNIAVNSLINVSGRGFSSSNGPGAGADWFHASSAGYGATGGRSYNTVLGGGAYGSITEPADLGSGGGRDSDENRIGGAGGGAIRLTVNGILTVNGELRANGNNGSGNQAGGGSGGSIWLTIGDLEGNGIISANGGTGSHTSYSGGGSGGRIAIYYDDISGFDGNISAFGAAGYYRGGNGTIYTKDSGSPRGTLQITGDGGGNRESTPLDAQTPSGALKVSSFAYVEVTDPITVSSLEIKNADTYIFPTVGQSLDIAVTGIMNIQTNAVITANGRGFGSSEGPGQGDDLYYAAGGAYGGNGGNSSVGAKGGMAYGSITEPTDLGSGGGLDADNSRNGGAGGGAIRITVGGNFILNGSLIANGNNGSSNEAGGGSGGSIWLTVGELNGNGLIGVNGGSGSNANVSGGGSGGRIAIYSSENNFSGVLSAAGGTGGQRGGAGTIFTKLSAETYGHLLIDNEGDNGNITPLFASFWPGGTIFHLAITNTTVTYMQNAATFASLTIDSGATLSHEGGMNGFDVTVLDDVNIKTNASISANARGFGSSDGPGAGGDLTYAGGGAYGGNGGPSSNGAPGGSAYGSIIEPNDLGSGGGFDTNNSRAGGAGGGVIRLKVNDTLTVNGAITANGANGGNESGGGSGGSIWLTVSDLIGNGIICADGGNGGNTSVSGGGSGGRIAIYYDDMSGFDGTITAFGGVGHGGGGAGTVYTKDSAQADGDLMIAANSTNRVSTPLDAQTPISNLEVKSSAYVEVTEPITMANVVLRDSGTVLAPPVGMPLDLTVQGNLNIRTDTTISANSRGYDSSNGPGAGDDFNYAGGGSYGGRGGDSSNGAMGGSTYGSITEPVNLGSGGGNDTDNNAKGGAGGGAIRLIVLGTLTVNGSLTANGGNGTTHSGGGSGGSIWATIGILNGNGVISANGGNSGHISVAGGGGGGRIAIYWRDAFSDFAVLEATGGTREGQVGTIFLFNGFLAGDYNLDNTVDVSDFAFFAAHWLESGCSLPTLCGGTDLNLSGEVDLIDFAIFNKQWLK